jgi:hypothetical protein
VLRVLGLTSFYLLVVPSFARYLADWLIDACAEQDSLKPWPPEGRRIRVRAKRPRRALLSKLDSERILRGAPTGATRMTTARRSR